jgi:hypothetical protein
MGIDGFVHVCDADGELLAIEAFDLETRFLKLKGFHLSCVVLMFSGFARLQQDALDVERRTIIRLRDEHVISDEVLRLIQRDLDHAEARPHARE